MAAIDAIRSFLGEVPGGMTLHVSQGRVSCPRRGDVDLEACVECRWLARVEGIGDPVVVCSWAPDRVESFAELCRPLS